MTETKNLGSGSHSGNHGQRRKTKMKESEIERIQIRKTTALALLAGAKFKLLQMEHLKVILEQEKVILEQEIRLIQVVINQEDI